MQSLSLYIYIFIYIYISFSLCVLLSVYLYLPLNTNISLSLFVFSFMHNRLSYLISSSRITLSLLLSLLMYVSFLIFSCLCGKLWCANSSPLICFQPYCDE